MPRTSIRMQRDFVTVTTDDDARGLAVALRVVRPAA
jgi:hypothetical protein